MTSAITRSPRAYAPSSLKDELAAKGLVFNPTDPAPFRQALRRAGFYRTWKQGFGAEAWSLLEAGSGTLAGEAG